MRQDDKKSQTNQKKRYKIIEKCQGTRDDDHRQQDTS